MTAPDVNADVRARFERNYMLRYPNAQGWMFYRDAAGNYMHKPAHFQWLGYRAAHADLSGEVRELVLDADARIGGTIFRKGVHWSTVIGRAQSEFRYHEENKSAPSDPKLSALVDAASEVCRISDRKHDAWDRLKAALAKFHPTHQEKP